MTNREVVIGFFKAIDHNDLVTAKKLLGSRHRIYSTMSPEPADADQHLAISKSFYESFSEGDHELVDILEDGNKVIARAVWHGVHTGTFNGIEPTGKKVKLSFITICEIENEEILNQWVEMDALSLMMQIGAMAGAEHA